ncbi:MAG TPA: ABC transporter permease [Vicinamibacterales bacterium]|nr:ABC transporter permease [Vicinamibacterales bacterium]
MGLSIHLLRLYLRTYPREFRERFGADLETDFRQLLATRGRTAAWRYALSDMRRAVPMTHSDDQRLRQRRFAMTLGSEGTAASLMFDTRHAVRALIKSPGFAAVTIATLALGIGANTAIFSLVNAVLLRPLGYHEPERLMMVHEVIPESKVPRFGVSPVDYLDLDQYQSAFSGVGAYRTRAMELSGTGSPESVLIAETTPSLLPLLGVNAAEGRTFLPEEGQSDPSVAVISDALRWRRYAASSPIGERIFLDRRPYTIVGVMPAGFEFPKRGPQFNSTPADIYLPLVFNPFERRARGMFYNHSVIGRLRDGVSPEQGARDTAALAGRIHDNYPAQLRNTWTLQLAVTPLLEEIAGQVRRPLWILLGAVGLVLLVACANVANLFLSRAVARRRELGVRVALGASRYRLFQMLLVESLLLALISGAAGLVIATWTLRAVPAVLTAGLPGLSEVTLDARVLAFTLTLSFLTALFFGVVPLAAGMRREVTDALREGARASGGRRQHRLQAGLIVTSVALAFVLLVASGLLIRSFGTLMRADSGVNALNVLSVEVSLPFAGYNQAPRIRAFYQTLHDRVRSLPGVKSAVITTDLPLRADGERRAFAPEGADPTADMQSSIALTWAHGDYFSTFGIPLIRGRNFTTEEQYENRLTVIVSKNLADRYWPGQDPIGKRLKWGVNTSSPAPWLTVVGVAGDVVDGPLGSEPVIHAYTPYSEMNDQGLASPLGGLWRRLNVAVNADVDAASLTSTVRAAITALDPALAVAKVTTMREVVRELSAPQRFSAAVLTAFAAGALLLASIGLYGVLAFAVAQRTREIGVRLALGAPRATVLTLILRQGMVLVAVGLVIGLGGALGATRLLRSLLYETNIYDPLTFVVVPILLALVSLAACYLPARRAAELDPLVTLRSE